MRHVLLLGLAACATSESVGPADSAAPSTADCATWATVGEPFVLTWCNGCHSAELPAGLRYGAPVGMDFDTLDAVRSQEAAFLAAALSDTPRMPPSGGVPLADREAMAAWFACGAPGEPHRLTPAPSGVTYLQAGELLGGFGEPTPGQYMSLFQAQDAAELMFFFAGDLYGDFDLVGWTVFKEGVPVGSGEYDPGLPLWPLDRAGDHPVQQQVSWDGVDDNGEVTWTFSVEDEPNPDPRFGDLDTRRWSLTDEAGASFDLWISTKYGLIAADYAWGPVSGHRVDRVLMLSSAVPTDRSDGFPLRAGDAYIIRRTALVEEP